MKTSLTRQSIFGFAAVLTMLAMLVDPSVANEAAKAGSNLTSTLQGAITGQIGLFIGLAIVVLGLWTWIIKQETGAGITMIVGGVLITMAPGLFNGAREFTLGLVSSISGGKVYTVETRMGN